MRKYILLLLIFAALLSGCVRDKITNFRLNAVVTEINKRCPIQVDPVTILLNAQALPNAVLLYNYEVKSGIKESDTIIAKRVFRRKIIYNLRNNPEMKALTDAQVTFMYDYSSGKGKHLFRVNVTPDEYQQRNGKGYLSDQNLATLISDAAWNNRLLLPITLDKSSVWIDSQFSPPDTLLMIYEVDRSQINFDYFSPSTLRNILVRNTISDKSSLELKDKGCVFKHIYRVSKGHDIQVVIGPSDYK
jgi:hypothetical protein